MDGFKNREGNPEKFLIIHAKTGGGHYIASRSIENYIKENFRIAEIKNVDGLKNAFFPYPLMPFLWDLLSEIPFLWRIVFYSSNIKKIYKTTLLIQTLLLYPSLKRLIKFYKPEVVFITHPFYIPPLFKIKKKLKINFFLITVLTDFGEIHESWLFEGSDLLWIPSKYTYNEIKNRIKNIKFDILGYPVRKDFLKRKKLKKDRVLLMGGGTGRGPIFEILRILTEEFRDLKITVICGKNKKLHRKIAKFLQIRNLENIELIGFTDKVAEYMRKSKFLISKPGGSTVAEAVYTKTPLIAIDAVPGQEKGNVKFLESINAGKEITVIREIPDLIKKIVQGEIKFTFKEDLTGYEKKKRELFEKIIWNI